MRGASRYYPREGIITFLTYLVLLPICVVFFVTLFGLLLGAGFGAGVSQLVQRIPGYLDVAFESFDTNLVALLTLFALYFGMRAALTHWIGRLEAALAVVVMPIISLSAVGLYHSPWQSVRNDLMNKLMGENSYTVAILLPALASVLFCRFLLVKRRVLYRQAVTS